MVYQVQSINISLFVGVFLFFWRVCVCVGVFVCGATIHKASHGPLGGAWGGADPLGVHVEAFVEGKEDSRDEAEEVSE